jgi:hypothetical protein
MFPFLALGVGEFDPLDTSGFFVSFAGMSTA